MCSSDLTETTEQEERVLALLDEFTELLLSKTASPYTKLDKVDYFASEIARAHAEVAAMTDTPAIAEEAVRLYLFQLFSKRHRTLSYGMSLAEDMSKGFDQTVKDAKASLEARRRFERFIS